MLGDVLSVLGLFLLFAVILLLLSADVMFFVFWPVLELLNLRKIKASGKEAMIGRQVEVRKELAPRGKVFFQARFGTLSWSTTARLSPARSWKSSKYQVSDCGSKSRICLSAIETCL